jgi:hypothetical protein
LSWCAARLEDVAAKDAESIAVAVSEAYKGIGEVTPQKYEFA